ncbi:hypothetical protein B0H21DRAFT_735209 [Amylocystis lapponica]|nr:hypothetical protein B0H21DRAFT_735209 [Amylocystis lapponica]
MLYQYCPCIRTRHIVPNVNPAMLAVVAATLAIPRAVASLLRSRVHEIGSLPEASDLGADSEPRSRHPWPASRCHHP